MIISHRHRFIFLKPRKVAGTSVEVALAEHCGPEDVITPIGAYNPAWDRDRYQAVGRKWPGLRRHATLAEARRWVGEEVWRSYFTFTVVRNPWDLVVSQYHWATRNDQVNQTVRRLLWRFVRKPRRLQRNVLLLGARLAEALGGFQRIDFDFFATFMLRYYPHNDAFYFGEDGRLGLDFVIRYEHLAADLAEVCDRLGLPGVALPSLKSKVRPTRDYRPYYDARTRSNVACFYQRFIDTFGYAFADGPAECYASPAPPVAEAPQRGLDAQPDTAALRGVG